MKRMLRIRAAAAVVAMAPQPLGASRRRGVRPGEDVTFTGTVTEMSTPIRTSSCTGTSRMESRGQKWSGLAHRPEQAQSRAGWNQADPQSRRSHRRVRDPSQDGPATYCRSGNWSGRMARHCHCRRIGLIPRRSTCEGPSIVRDIRRSDCGNARRLVCLRLSEAQGRRRRGAARSGLAACTSARHHRRLDDAQSTRTRIAAITNFTLPIPS